MNFLKTTLLYLIASSSAFAGIDVGWIEKINGYPSDVLILRKGQKIEATQFLPIQNGDQVSVLSKSTSLVVSLSNMKSLKVENSKPIIIQQTGEVPALFSNLFNWIASLDKDLKAQRIITASSRSSSDGKGLTIPLLKDDTTLISGDRILALAWHGGTAPYEVSLVQRETRKVSAQFLNLESNRLVATVSITPGQYELIVSDSDRTEWREKVLAVASRPIPEPPAELIALHPYERRLATAIWLAGIEEGKWALEAYTLIAVQPQHDKVETNFLNALEIGHFPEVK